MASKQGRCYHRRRSGGRGTASGSTEPHSSRGPGHRPLKAETTGSNPVCGTNPSTTSGRVWLRSGEASRRPGDRGDRERRDRQPDEAALAQRRSSFPVEPDQVGARGTDAARERLPPLLEARVLETGGQGGRLDVAQPCSLEQLHQLTL